MKRKFCTVLAGGFAAAVLIAGCGGSDDSDDGESAATTASTTTEAAAPPTKKEYIAAADDICREGIPQAKALVRKLIANNEAINSATEDQYAALSRKGADLSDQVIAYRQGVTAAIRDLEPPEDGGATEFLNARDKTDEIRAAEAKAARAYAKDVNEETSQAFADAAARTAERVEVEPGIAKDYGFKVCGEPINEDDV